MSVTKIFSILDRIPQAEVLNDGLKNNVVDAIMAYTQNPNANINDVYSVLSFLGKVCDDVISGSKQQLINHVNTTGDNKTSFGQKITFRTEYPFDYNKDPNMSRLDKVVKNATAEYSESKAILKKACETATAAGQTPPVPSLPPKISVVVVPEKA